MDVVTLVAEPRDTGKKGAKATRRQDKVPCVLYGHGIDPVHFQVPTLSLRPLIYTHETHRVEVKLGKKQYTCVLKKVDFNPVTDRPAHADFQVLIAGKKVQLTIPVSFTGIPLGQELGGVTEHLMTELSVYCLPKNIPANIQIDVSGMNIGDAIHVRDLDFPDLEFMAPADQTVVAVYGRARPAGEEGEEEELEAETAGEQEESGEEERE